jgi:hypothetical protein
MTYTAIRQKTAALLGTQPTCLDCRTPQSPATLSSYGKRCFACFKAHCREPLPQVGRSKAAERIRAEIVSTGRKLPA